MERTTATRTTRWIWTECPDKARAGRHRAYGMAEFWAFMGKARGFTVGLHSKDSLETGARHRTGTVYLLDSGPLHQDHGHSRVEASGCITRSSDYLTGLNRPWGTVFPVSPARINLYIEHSPCECASRIPNPPRHPQDFNSNPAHTFRYQRGHRLAIFDHQFC